MVWERPYHAFLWVYLSRCSIFVWWVHIEKINKDKQRFGRDPRRLQLLILSDAEKSCQQIPQIGVGQPCNFPTPKFSDNFGY